MKGLKGKTVSAWRNTELQVIKRNEAYLYSGKYRLCFVNHRFMWTSGLPFFKWFSGVLFYPNMLMRYKLKILLKRNRYTVKQDGDQACGTCLYQTRKKQIKVFDYEKGIVSYYLKDPKALDTGRAFHEQYAPFFGRPVIREINEGSCLVRERLLKETNQWRYDEAEVLKAIAWFHQSALAYVEQAEKKTVSVAEFVEDARQGCRRPVEQALMERILEAAQDLPETVVLVPQHNDVVLGNIVSEAEGYTLTDYEFFNENLFYYDSMMSIVWESIRKRSHRHIADYLKGFYDGFFEELFRLAGMEFEPEKRKEYVLLFLAANIRVHTMTGDKTSSVYYGDFLDRLLQEDGKEQEGTE